MNLHQLQQQFDEEGASCRALARARRVATALPPLAMGAALGFIVLPALAQALAAWWAA